MCQEWAEKTLTAFQCKAYAIETVAEDLRLHGFVDFGTDEDGISTYSATRKARITATHGLTAEDVMALDNVRKREILPWFDLLLIAATTRRADLPKTTREA